MQGSVKLFSTFARQIGTLLTTFAAERREKRRRLPPLALTYKFTNQ